MNPWQVHPRRCEVIIRRRTTNAGRHRDTRSGSVALVTGQAHQGGADTRETAEKTILANERALYEALAKADKASFQSLVVSEGIWTTPTGFVPIQLLTGSLESFHVIKWNIQNPRVFWLDDNPAFVLSTRTVDGRFGEGSLPPTALASTVWTRRNGAWRAMYHQESELTR